MPTPDFMFLSNISLFCQHAVVLSVATFPPSQCRTTTRQRVVIIVQAEPALHASSAIRPNNLLRMTSPR